MLSVLSILFIVVIKISWFRASLKLSCESFLASNQYNRLSFPLYCIYESRIVDHNNAKDVESLRYSHFCMSLLKFRETHRVTMLL